MRVLSKRSLHVRAATEGSKHRDEKIIILKGRRIRGGGRVPRVHCRMPGRRCLGWMLKGLRV